MIIDIPLKQIHLDPKYYQDPTEYRPERFYKDNKPSPLLLSFGLGPRNCIGKLLKPIFSIFFTNFKESICNKIIDIAAFIRNHIIHVK